MEGGKGLREKGVGKKGEDRCNQPMIMVVTAKGRIRKSNRGRRRD